jgi:dipeptidyl-peptidase-4
MPDVTDVAEPPLVEGSFPRQAARTRRFTLGQPRDIFVAADGSRVSFLRSRAGDDPLTCLWVLDVDARSERLVADPVSLAADGQGPVSLEERARRERTRETAEGIVQYAADPALRVAAFSLGGRLHVADLVRGGVHRPHARPSVFDPRPDPTGTWVAYVSAGGLRVVPLAPEGHSDGGGDRALAEEDDPDVTWGMAEFVAAEEMGRLRGFWWAPDGRAIVAARVDVGPVVRWHVADPANPDRAPVPMAFPAAGTANAVVTLHVLGLDGSRVDIRWDREAFPYVVGAAWTEHGPLVLLVQSRDQRAWTVLAVDASTGGTGPVWEDRNDRWLTIVPGVPDWTTDGRLVMVGDRGDSRALLVDGSPVTPEGLHVRCVVHVDTDVVFAATGEDPMEVHLWRHSAGGELIRLTQAQGVHAGAAGGDVVVVSWTSMDHDGLETVVRRGNREAAAISSHAETPAVVPSVAFLRAGGREIRTAVLLPTGPGHDGSLPVLVDPYGGPEVQRVVRSRNAYLESQWLADQGFAVVVADGRGTPGRGVAWEQAIHLDYATPVLEDQVEALHGAVERFPQLDPSRVAIRGWSFGGYLAAMAVLRRPDVFHAAVAGAPVTDQRLYDTHYTERYLGHPDEHPDAYDRCSLVAEAPNLSRPLLLIHGLADDNVVVAHTLRLSRALLEAGRDHRVLLLPGITHMTAQVIEHLLRIQVRFLREALGLPPGR